ARLRNLMRPRLGDGVPKGDAVGEADLPSLDWRASDPRPHVASTTRGPTPQTGLHPERPLALKCATPPGVGAPPHPIRGQGGVSAAPPAPPGSRPDGPSPPARPRWRS